jgi:hypothetical protein
MKRVMKSAVSFLLFTVLCLAARAADEFLPGMFEGTFHGEVFNGNDLDTVVTTIQVDRNGRMSGEYEVAEENGPYKGRLSNFRFVDAHTVEMEWTDKFGEGYALMEFARDFNSFVGGWNTIDQQRLLHWDGKKQDN